jgi:uncharacterized protein (TIGR00255 family)
MIRSMTGFARVRRQLDTGELIFSVKSVNHRGLDPHFHVTAELEPYEPALREIIKREVLRGHLDVRVSFTSVSTAGVSSLNLPLLRECFAAFAEAVTEFGLHDARFDLNSALRIPGVVGGWQGQEPDPALEAALLSAAAEALETLNSFRAREGAELALGIRLHNRAILECAEQLAEIRARAVPILQARLSERLRELLRNAVIDPQRLTQEAAILADRSDIGEEIERLNIHSRQIEGLLDTGGEMGKKLDFLLQEMHRETNTILSKTNGVGELGLKITGLALAVKAGIEKIREQALNLE